MSYRFDPNRPLTLEEITQIFREQLNNIPDSEGDYLLTLNTVISLFLIKNDEIQE